mmetsp:Transcript_36505/g.85792  ORF Transcript_36505/g.85792 Transcript_36505/m.85792 type:complete len:201 (+) Transcript_36505:662-1264(+)
MHIPVVDQHALLAPALLGLLGSDCHVVEHAEPHHVRPLGVVARGAHDAEAALCLPGADLLGDFDDRASCHARGRRARIVLLLEVGAGVGCGVPCRDRRHMLGRVHGQELRVCRWPPIDHTTPLDQPFVVQQLPDPIRAFRALHMPPSVVWPMSFVEYQHRPSSLLIHHRAPRARAQGHTHPGAQTESTPRPPRRMHDSRI